jgi:hypothetical protein
MGCALCPNQTRYKPKDFTVKPKRHQNLSPEVIAEVNARADATVGVGRCEDCGKEPDWRGLCMAEPIKGMGGTTRIFRAAEVKRKCYPCHNNNDHHLREK